MSYRDCHPLIVDDDGDYIFLLRRTLTKIGIPASQVLVALDGQAAVDLLSGGKRTPSLILLDLKLPKLSGLEVLEWIRNSSGLKALPVFMLTTSTDPGEMSRAFELGVTSYFVKPLGLTDLEGILEGIAAWWKNSLGGGLKSLEPPAQ